jgi:hypothetical protein
MALSPWRNGRIELDDGLSGPLQPTIIGGVTAA